MNDITMASRNRRTDLTSCTGAVVQNFGKRYQRTPIDPKRQFRLLSVQAGSRDERVKCLLETHDLGNAPFYRALSYTWGTGYQKTIHLEDGTFSVGSNLFGVLRHIAYMKQKGKSGWNGRWWIDAICIDQNNYLEKIGQIRNMGRIYRDAAEVVAWLGEGNDRIYEAMKILQRDMPQVSDVVVGPRVRQSGPLSPPSAEVREAIKGVKEIFDRDYWDRAWILQELAVSHKRRVVCGKGELDWTNLVRFATMIASNDNPHPWIREARKSIIRIQPVWLLSLLYYDKRWRQTLELGKLLYLSKHAKATWEMDHIIAVQGMVTTGAGCDLQVADRASDCSVICRAIRRIFEDMDATGRWPPHTIATCHKLANDCRHNPLSKDVNSQNARNDCDRAQCGSLLTCRRIVTVLYKDQILYSSAMGSKTVHYALTGLWQV